MFLGSEVFRFSIKFGEVLVMFSEKSWRVGGNCSGLYRLGILGETRLGAIDTLLTKVS